MTPGAYLRLRREAAGLSVEQVAERLRTEPRIAEFARAEWIELIEGDAMPAAFSTIVALRCAFRFDLAVLEALAIAQLGAFAVAIPICRKCGCTEEDACAGRCWWAEPDLCSACVNPVAAVDAIHAAAAGPAA